MVGTGRPTLIITRTLWLEMLQTSSVRRVVAFIVVYWYLR